MLNQLEGLTGEAITRLHIVGGGTKSPVLSQYAANATGRTVLTGPVEATAAGNILIQALTLGHIESLEALRSIVRKSFPIKKYQPVGAEAWDQAFTRFSALTQK